VCVCFFCKTFKIGSQKRSKSSRNVRKTLQNGKTPVSSTAVDLTNNFSCRTSLIQLGPNNSLVCKKTYFLCFSAVCRRNEEFVWKQLRDNASLYHSIHKHRNKSVKNSHTNWHLVYRHWRQYISVAVNGYRTNTVTFLALFPPPKWPVLCRVGR